MNDLWVVTPVPDLNLLKYEKDGWVIECSWPERGKAGEVNVKMRIQNLAIGGGTVMSKRRINIRSSGATNGILTLVNRTLPDTAAKAQWQMDFQKVLENIEHWYEKDKEVEQPDPAAVEEHVDWLLYPIWPAEGVTGVAAAPGSLKSYIAQTIALSLHYDTPLLQRNTKTMGKRRILYLDWEDRPATFASRLKALQVANGIAVEAVLDYKQLTVSMDDAAEGINEITRRDHYDGIIIDSMSASIDGGMNDDQAVNAFWSAIYRVGVPSLVLAHKSVANQNNRTARFFGSGMSEARVRMAWNAEITPEHDYVKWDCFKDNSHGKLGSKLAWQVEFEMAGEDEHSKVSGVSFMGVNPDSVLFEDSGDGGGAKEPAWTPWYRYMISHGTMTTAEAAAEFGVQTATIRGWGHNSDGSIYRAENGKWAALHG